MTDGTDSLDEIARRSWREAASAGLCRDGRIELAVAAVRHADPALSADAALAFVLDVADDDAP